MITKYIQRHSVLARITHGVVAISCILLAITGLFVMITAWNNGVVHHRYALDAQTARHSVYSDSASGDHHFSEGFCSSL